MKPVSFWMITVVALAGLQGCSGGNGNGGDDGGQTRCGDLICSSSKQCVAESVCVSTPLNTAQACEEVEDKYHAIGDADLACHNGNLCSADTDCPLDASGAQMICRGGFCALPAPAGGPGTVTFRGCVDAFGIGDTTHQMKAALYRASQDPTGATQWDVSTTEDQAGCEYWGAFEFENVPTNTPLILKSYDDLGDFVVTYKYNIILWSDLARDDGGTWVFDTRDTARDPRTGLDIPLHPWWGYAISQTTYNVILLAAGIRDLPETSGAVAGTIRDCQYREMQYVTCNTVDEAEVLTYFTNADNPRPDDSIDYSNVNGIYAAIDLPQGEHRISCLARDPAGAAVPLGEYPFEVFPHAITIISMDWYPGAE